VPSSAVVPLPSGVPGVPTSQASHGVNPKFPWGQCTGSATLVPTAGRRARCRSRARSR
jgi:hypothetical protein